MDQNAWVYLAQEYYHKDNSRGLSDTLSKILKLSESGKVIFPLSVVHMDETGKSKRSAESRKRLTEFMIKLSKGYAILPYTKVMNREMRNAIFMRLRLPTLQYDVIRRGAPYMLDDGYRIEGNIPVYLRQELRRVTDSPETFLKLLNDQKTINFIQKNSDKQAERLRIILERSRAEVSHIHSKADRYKLELYKTFRDSVIRELATMTIQLNLPKESIRLDTLSAIEYFLSDVPTLFVLFTLMHRRSMVGDRKIQKNDFNDINALSIAIPYCDIVVTDKFRTSIALQSRMDRRFQTTILSSPRDLETHLS